MISPKAEPVEQATTSGRVDAMPLSQTTVQGSTSIGIGAVTMCVGIPIMLVGTGTIRVSPSSVHAPYWVIGMIGGLFTTVGVLFMLNGLLDLRRGARSRRAEAQHPHEPWLWDHPWDIRGERGRESGSLLARIVGVAFLGAFLTPFNWWAFIAGGGIIVILVVGLFDLILFFVLIDLLRRIMARLRYGRPRLRFRTVPIRPGELVDGELVCPKGIGRFDALELTLRFIEERYEVRGSGKSRKQVVECYALYTDSTTIQVVGLHEQGDAALPISFLLPEDARSTAISRRPAVYWEIKVRASTPGVDFHESFLVPVYAADVS
ncbi:MAG: hypothetical protein AAFX05_00825 [Planctomycetota bacterium]